MTRNKVTRLLTQTKLDYVMCMGVCLYVCLYVLCMHCCAGHKRDPLELDGVTNGYELFMCVLRIKLPTSAGVDSALNH